MNSTYNPPVGHVTTSGHIICASCAINSDLLAAHRVGTLAAPIVHPAPNGIYHAELDGGHYDRPCFICGWAVRREHTSTNR